MRLLFIFSMTLTGLTVFGQIKINYLFHDLCKDTIIECNYELFNPDSPKVHTSTGRYNQLNTAGLYIMCVRLTRGNQEVEFGDDIFSSSTGTQLNKVFYFAGFYSTVYNFT